MTEQGAARFKVSIDGIELVDEELRHVTSIEFTEAMDKLDALSMRLAVPTVEKWWVTALCNLGATFDIELGYSSDTALQKGSGDITEISWNQSPSAPQAISLTGLDGLHRLKGKAQSKVWDVGHNTIAEEIAGEHGMTPVVEGVDSSPTHTFQDNETDAVFLRNLAKDHHYFVRVQKNEAGEFELRFGRLSLAYQPDTVTVTWGKDVESLQIRASINDLVTTTKVKGRNYSQNQDVEAECAEVTNISGGQTGVEIVQDVFGEQEHLIDHARRNQSSSATDRASSEMQERAQKFLKGNLTCIGRPEAVSGGMIEIEGLPWPYMGPFLITQTTHTLEPGVGYRTKIDFVSDSFPPEE